MIPILELWVPILLSAAIVWIASAIVWMALPHHKTDLEPLPDEDSVMKAVGPVPPGVYSMPYVKEWSSATPEIKEKLAQGPSGFVTILKWSPNMTKQLSLWFVHLTIIGVFVAYIAGRTLPRGTEYLDVFQITGAIAVLAHGAGSFVESIYWGRPWSTTVKNSIDATIYGLLTAGVFAWLWP